MLKLRLSMPPEKEWESRREEHALSCGSRRGTREGVEERGLIRCGGSVARGKVGGMYIGGVNGIAGQGVFLWIEGRQGEFARRVMEESGLEVVGLGVVDGDAGRIGGELFAGAAVVDDLRSGVTGGDGSVVVLGTMRVGGGMGGGGYADDVELIGLARESGKRIVSLCAVPGSLRGAELMERGGRFGDGLVGLMSRGSAFGEAMEEIGGLGVAKCVSVLMLSAGEQGGLGGRVLDAMDVVHRVLGVADSVDAGVVTSTVGGGGGVRAAAAERLDRLTGDMHASLRYAGLMGATIHASDRAGAWSREVVVVGETGSVRITDEGVERVSADGERMYVRAAGAGEEDGEMDAAVGAMSRGMRRALEGVTGTARPTDGVAVVLMAEAALLSARTGQAESPEMIRRIAGVG